MRAAAASNLPEGLRVWSIGKKNTFQATGVMQGTSQSLVNKDSEEDRMM